jgi:hypothetical protein
LLDLGHIRDLADMTRFIHDSMLGGFSRLELFEGTANVHAIPKDRASILELAGAIAYVESWAHELTTWGTLSQDFSSFSPEDLPSNICGIELGKRAIRAGGKFDTSIDTILDAMLNHELGVRSKIETKAVLDKIKNKWFALGAPLTLLRRNFDGKTWPAGMPYDAPASIPWLSPSVFEPFYGEFTYVISDRVAGTSGVTLAGMKAVTAGIQKAFVAANPGMDAP